MSPGQGVDKSILSTADLKSHAEKVHEWGPQELVKALTNDGFSAKMKNPHQNEEESLCNLICFGSSEVIVFNIEYENQEYFYLGLRVFYHYFFDTNSKSYDF